MGLYDRNYINDEAKSHTHSMSDTALVGFVKTTYKFFAASLLFATIGALIGMQYFEMAVQYRLPIIIVELVAFFVLMFSRSKPGLNLAMLFIFTFLSGVTLVPLLGFVISRAGIGGVWQALAMTTIIFGIMSVYALKTKSDLSNMGKMLFIALIVVVVFSLINLFLGSALMTTIISAIGAIIFSLYIAYDTQNIVRGLYKDPIMAAVGLYLDFLNLFISLLQLIGIFGGRND